MVLAYFDDDASSVPDGGRSGFGSSLCHLLLAGRGLWCVHSIYLGGACDGVSMPLLLSSRNPSRLGVDGIYRAG